MHPPAAGVRQFTRGFLGIAFRCLELLRRTRLRARRLGDCFPSFDFLCHAGVGRLLRRHGETTVLQRERQGGKKRAGQITGMSSERLRV